MYNETHYSLGKNLTAGQSNTIFKVPLGHEAKITMLLVSNTGSGNRSFDATWHGEETIEFRSGVSVHSGNYDSFGGDGVFLMLMEHDYLTITPQSNSDFSAVVSFTLRKTDGTKFDLTI